MCVSVSRCVCGGHLVAVTLRGGLLLSGAPLALRQADGVTGPVVHQLVQVVSEGAFAALVGSAGELGLGGSAGLALEAGSGGQPVVLTGPLARPAHHIGAASPCGGWWDGGNKRERDAERESSGGNGEGEENKRKRQRERERKREKNIFRYLKI